VGVACSTSQLVLPVQVKRQSDFERTAQQTITPLHTTTMDDSDIELFGTQDSDNEVDDKGNVDSEDDESGNHGVDQGEGNESEDKVKDDIEAEEDDIDNSTLFNKRKLASSGDTSLKAPKLEPGSVADDKYKDVIFSMMFGNLEELRQLVSLYVHVQQKSAVDGVLFHVVHEEEDGEEPFSGLVSTLFLSGVLMTGRLKCKMLHYKKDERTCFYVNVEDLSLQLRHIKQDNGCIITKYRGDTQLRINVYSIAPGTSNTQRMTLTELAIESDDPDYFPEMQYEFSMVITAMDLKSLVQQSADIGASCLEVTLYRKRREGTSESSGASGISSLFQFDAVTDTRSKSIQQRYVNMGDDSMDTEGVYSLDTIIDDSIKTGELVKVRKCAYSVDTLKSLTMSLKNQHQLTLSFGVPKVKDQNGQFLAWEDYQQDEEAEFVYGAMYIGINLGPETYIKMLLARRVDGEDD
jgi:hypothetical protein